MLRRFESIKNCGIFEDFRWDSGVPDFERINLIYGSNGSGKTSLAHALEDRGDDGSGSTNGPADAVGVTGSRSVR